MKFVPTPSDGHPDTRVRVALSGATYAIRWLWNDRDRMWSFSMWDPDGAPLVMGVRVALSTDLLAWTSPDAGRPPYGIGVLDPTGSGEEPTRETLGARVKVVYAEPDAEDAA